MKQIVDFLGGIHPVCAALLAKAGKSVLVLEKALADAEKVVFDRAREGADIADDYVRENPWNAVAIAAGVGLLLGAPAGFFASRAYARSRPLSDGQARAITLGGTWGTWQGFGWASVLDLGTETVRECPLGPDDCFEYETGDDTEEKVDYYREGLELLQRAVGYGLAGELVRAPRDRHRLPVDIERDGCCRRFHDLDAFGNDFETDVVAFEYSELQHCSFPSMVNEASQIMACVAKSADVIVHIQSKGMQ